MQRIHNATVQIKGVAKVEILCEYLVGAFWDIVELRKGTENGTRSESYSNSQNSVSVSLA